MATDNDEFPGNSISKQTGSSGRKSEEKKKVEKVVTGSVSTKKKSLWRKMKDRILPASDAESVFEYIFLDILIPAGKDALFDAATGGLERKLWNGEGGRRGRGRGGRTAYHSIRGNIFRDEAPSRRSSERPSRRSTREFGDVLLESRAEAVDVIDAMFELISRYEVATLADLCDLIGEPHNFTDNNWGWTDFRGADVHRTGDGYLLILPRIEALD